MIHLDSNLSHSPHIALMYNIYQVFAAPHIALMYNIYQVFAAPDHNVILVICGEGPDIQ